MTKKVLLLGVLSVAMLPMAPAAWARDDDRDRARRRDDDRPRFREVDLKDVPAAVRRTIDQEKGEGKITEVQRVDRGNQTYYKAIVDRGERDLIVVVNRDGELRSLWDRTGEGGARKVVRYDDLPESVQKSLSREFGKDKIIRAYELNRHGRTYYDVRVRGEGSVMVDSNGKQLDEDHDYWDDRGTRREMSFQTLPGQVKSTIGKEIGGNKVDRVFQVQRDGKTFYLVRSVDGRTLRVASDGTLMEERDADRDRR